MTNGRRSPSIARAQRARWVVYCMRSDSAEGAGASMLLIVFVFDFSMPMIDGAMLFTLIGKVYNHVNPPVVVPPLILISGRGDEARAQELMKEAGLRGFLSKPFAMNRLMEKISEVAPDLAVADEESTFRKSGE